MAHRYRLQIHLPFHLPILLRIPFPSRLRRHHPPHELLIPHPADRSRPAAHIDDPAHRVRRSQQQRRERFGQDSDAGGVRIEAGLHFVAEGGVWEGGGEATNGCVLDEDVKVTVGLCRGCMSALID
jgi:hypothetical protein